MRHSSIGSKYSGTVDRLDNVQVQLGPLQTIERKPATGFGTAAVDALREQHDGEPTSALKEIRCKLEIAGVIGHICAATLRAEATDEQDVALCLRRRLVGDKTK